MGIGVTTVELSSDSFSDDLDRALSGSGFVELVEHGFDPHATAAFRVACDAFFSLTSDVKAAHVVDEPLANRGWRAPGSESLAYSLGRDAPADVFESFNMGAMGRGASEFHGTTPWPDEVVPGFSDAAHAMLGAFEALSRRLDRVLGERLGVDLESVSNAGPDMMAAIDYHTGHTEAFEDGQLRMGAHSDYTTFTMLLADPVPGLQIVGSDGRWVDVQPAPGALLMNVGDLLAMLSNDRYPSTLHRVVPPRRAAGASRRSVAYFHYPNLDVEVAPAVDSEAHYEPITVEAHLRSKLAAPKTHKRSTGVSTLAGRLDR